ncbi:hypothetical protein M422DRAFT_190184, partial [Sphaerobolus stellatus SS14]
YRACTDTDIALLSSLVSKTETGQVSLINPIFDNVSIITSKNRYWDKINHVGSNKFVQRTRQQLTNFYSLDTLTEAGVKNVLHISEKKRLNKILVQANNKINPGKQIALWNLNAESTCNKPGMLPLCIGMPVMIKKNIATELCMTNGAEGHVLGWQSSMIDMNNIEYPVLDIVYILLKDTAFSINIPGLPENVVPITRTSCPITCEFPNGHSQRINRDQVDIILNFAMTDYASQGRTRPITALSIM